MRVIGTYPDLVEALLEIVAEFQSRALTAGEWVEIELALHTIRSGADLEFSCADHCGLLLHRVFNCGSPIQSRGFKGLYELLADQYLRGGLLPLRTETYLQSMIDFTYMDWFLAIQSRGDTTDVVMRNAEGARCYEMEVAVSFPRDPTRRRRQKKAMEKSKQPLTFATQPGHVHDDIHLTALSNDSTNVIPFPVHRLSPHEET